MRNGSQSKDHANHARVSVQSWFIVVCAVISLAEVRQCRAAEKEEVLSPNVVANASWADLANIMGKRYDNLVLALRKDAKTATTRPIPAEDRFIAAYAFIAQNRSSDAWMLLTAPAILPTPEEYLAWSKWTASALEQVPHSLRLRFLYADALARTSSHDKAIQVLVVSA